MFEVQHYTLCDGWLNCWLVDDKPETFATEEEAQTAIDDHVIDYINAVQGGDIAEEDEENIREHLRIKEIKP